MRKTFGYAHRWHSICGMAYFRGTAGELSGVVLYRSSTRLPIATPGATYR